MANNGFGLAIHTQQAATATFASGYTSAVIIIVVTTSFLYTVAFHPLFNAQAKHISGFFTTHTHSHTHTVENSTVAIWAMMAAVSHATCIYVRNDRHFKSQEHKEELELSILQKAMLCSLRNKHGY